MRPGTSAWWWVAPDAIQAAERGVARRAGVEPEHRVRPAEVRIARLDHLTGRPGHPPPSANRREREDRRGPASQGEAHRRAGSMVTGVVVARLERLRPAGRPRWVAFATCGNEHQAAGGFRRVALAVERRAGDTASEHERDRDWHVAGARERPAALGLARDREARDDADPVGEAAQQRAVAVDGAAERPGSVEQVADGTGETGRAFGLRAARTPPARLVALFEDLAGIGCSRRLVCVVELALDTAICSTPSSCRSSTLAATLV